MLLKEKSLWGTSVCLFLALSCGSVAAKEYSSSDMSGTSTKAIFKPNLTLEGQLGPQRVCYYNGQAYSLGSVLAVEGIVLECTPEKTFETNGKLKWSRIEKTSSN